LAGNYLKNTDSYSVGLSTTVTAKSTVSTNPLKSGASLTVEVKAEAAMKQTTTFRQNEETKIMSASEAYRDQSTKLGESTTLQMWFIIENVGDDLLTDPLSELTLNLFLGNDKTPFHTETFENTITNLEPTQSVSLTIKDIPLNLEQAQRFLANEGVRVEVEHFQFGMDQVYLINAEASNLKLITVSQDGVDSRFVYLPTVMNLEQVLETANIDYGRDDESGAFTYIGNMQSKSDTIPYKTLTIYHTPNPNAISPPPSNLDDMLFENGDVLVIKHQTDTDGDLLTDRDELLMGTNLNEKDTDGDGLWDGFYSSDDAIGAELTTFCDETKEKTTNPLLSDTDGDGIKDGADPIPCVKKEEDTGWSDWGLWLGKEVPNIGVISDIAAVKKDGRQQVFTIGKNYALWHIWQNAPNSGWSDWSSLGGKYKDIEVGQNKDGRLEVFGIGPDDSALYHIWQKAAGGWNSYSLLEKGSWTGIAVGRNQDGRQEVFTIGNNEKLYHIWQKSPNSGWSNFDNEGGRIKVIEVGKNADGRQEVFAIGSDNAVHHIWQKSPNGDWSGWKSLGGWWSDIAVGRNQDGRLEVFAIDSAGVLKQIAQKRDGGWGDTFGRLGGGGGVKDIEVGKNKDGRLEVFGIGSDGALWHISQKTPNGGWTNWSSLGGDVKEIEVGQNQDGRLEVFGIGSDGAFYNISQKAPNSGWGR